MLKYEIKNVSFVLKHFYNYFFKAFKSVRKICFSLCRGIVYVYFLSIFLDLWTYLWKCSDWFGISMGVREGDGWEVFLMLILLDFLQCDKFQFMKDKCTAYCAIYFLQPMKGRHLKYHQYHRLRKMLWKQRGWFFWGLCWLTTSWGKVQIASEVRLAGYKQQNVIGSRLRRRKLLLT